MAEAEVKQLRLNRRSAKANFVRKAKAVEQLIDHNCSKEEISEVFTQIESAFEKLEKTHEDYARTIEDEIEFLQEEDWLVECQKTFFSLKTKVKDYKHVGEDVNPVDKNTVALCSVILENPRSNAFGSTHQQNDTPTSDLILTSPDVKTAYSKDTSNKSEPKSNKSVCNPNDNADNPPHFSMSPVPQEMATEASSENGSSDSVVMADTSRRVKDTSVFELQENPSPGPAVELVDPHKGCSCPHEDKASYFSCSSSVSSSSQGRVSITATGDIPGTTEKKQPETHHVITCDGDKNMSSKEMSLKRTLSVDPEEQKCCKKRCLRFIGDDLSNKCHNMTMKQKEDYVKKYVVVYPNKTKKQPENDTESSIVSTIFIMIKKCAKLHFVKSLVFVQTLLIRTLTEHRLKTISYHIQPSAYITRVQPLKHKLNAQKFRMLDLNLRLDTYVQQRYIILRNQ